MNKAQKIFWLVMVSILLMIIVSIITPNIGLYLLIGTLFTIIIMTILGSLWLIYHLIGDEYNSY